MDPISVMNVLIKLFLLICTHFAQVRSSLYPGTTGKVTKVPFLLLIKLDAFKCVVIDSVAFSLAGQCITLFSLDARLLARSQYLEGPAIGHLDTGFSWFPCA